MPISREPSVIVNIWLTGSSKYLGNATKNDIEDTTKNMSTKEITKDIFFIFKEPKI